MGNKFDEMRWAVAEARRTMEAADSVVTEMAQLIKGRLKKVNSTYTLQCLKRELRDFNIHTGCWKE